MARLLTSPAPLAAAAEAESITARLAGRPVQAVLQGGRHDGVPGLLANAVLGFSWVAARPTGA